MATNKPALPSITFPDNFGTSASNVKTPYTNQELIDGYSHTIQQIYDGGNLNYFLGGVFQNMKYIRTFTDWLRGGTANTVPYINSSNQLDYATPVLAGANNTFTGSNTFNDTVFTGGYNAIQLRPSNETYSDISAQRQNSTSRSGYIRFFGNQNDNKIQIAPTDLSGSLGTGITLTKTDTTETATVIPPIDDTTSSSQIDTVGARNTKINNVCLQKNMISNCITEIPQDIKLELNNGTLTLKAGSRVYAPNGAGVFDVVNITSDKTTTSSTSGKVLILTTASGGVLTSNIGLSMCVSGSTDSLLGTPYHIWYDTTNNVVNYYGSDGTTPAGTRSLPVAVVNVSGGQISSIEQVFNGFGYIGSTVFALPGVKGLAPNGRNADGSLKNIEYKIDRVSISTNTGSSRNGVYIFGNNNINRIQKSAYKYDESRNVIINVSDGAIREIIEIGTTDGNITSFTPKTAFHALDYNEITGQLLESKGIRTVIETYETTNKWYRIYSDGWVEQGGYFDTNYLNVSLLKAMRDTNYQINISGKGSLDASTIQARYETVTTTTLEIRGGAQYQQIKWEVKGYGA